jgi:hypothetical protein
MHWLCHWPANGIGRMIGECGGLAISLKQNGNSISILTPVFILEFQKAKILRNDLVYSKQL